MKRGHALLLILALLLAACLPNTTYPLLAPWVYTDLRALDEAEAPLPTQDIIAVYLRRHGTELQIRLDLLDLAAQAEADLYLALDTAPGGSRELPLQAEAELDWDTLLVIPASGALQALGPDLQPRSRLSLRVLRDPAAETITLHVDQAALPGPAREWGLQVFLAPPGGLLPTDRTGPIRSQDPPPARIPLLLSFWNALPAYTPALALRRWDGAHTGPFGGRHGLYNLLRAARNRDIPIALLDLKDPASLSALDYVHGMDLVRDMASDGLLILPDSAPVFPREAPLPLPAWVLNRAAAESRQSGQDHGLPNSPFLYAPLGSGLAPGEMTHGYQVIFTPTLFEQPAAGEFRSPGTGQSGELSTVVRWGERKVIPIPANWTPKAAFDQAEPEGAWLEIRRLLVAAAQGTGSDRSELLVLGGDLPQSAWGDPSFARQALDWIAGRPWIQPLRAEDLLGILASSGYRPAQPAGGASPAAVLAGASQGSLAELSQALDSPLGAAAWQAYRSLYAPLSPAPAELPVLRSVYAGQVGALLAAARWASDPTLLASCDVDPDLDGQAECVLASEEVFALIEPGSASLVLAFIRAGARVHQVVAPSSQMITGLSEPSTWDLAAGLGADSNVIPGAFIDRTGPYQASLEGETIILAMGSGETTRTYSLLPGGLRLDLRSSPPSRLQIPLAVDPWERFTPGFGSRCSGELSTQGWAWGCQGGPRVTVRTSGSLDAHSFIDTRERMGTTENPNAEYPPGHYLPFAMSLVEIQGEGDVFVEILIE